MSVILAADFLKAGKSFTVDTPEALLHEWDRLIKEGEPYLTMLRVRNQVLLEGLIAAAN